MKQAVLAQAQIRAYPLVAYPATSFAGANGSRVQFWRRFLACVGECPVIAPNQKVGEALTIGQSAC
jgi:hypothetical protein